MIVNMHSPTPDDRTARARIRDEALRLFAEHGTDGVTMRDIAAAAGVSPALLIRHFGSKDGLIAAVDGHVVAALEALLGNITAATGSAGMNQSALPGLLDGLAAQLPPDSPIPPYLTRALIAGSPWGVALFGRLYEVSRHALDTMIAAGAADDGGDPAVRAAFLLANDLAVLMLRDHLTTAIGVDPLSIEGAQRWGAAVFAVYRAGLTGTG